MSEVKRYVCHGCVWLPRDAHCPICDPEKGWGKELDAQRLRADTAERGLANCKLALDAQTHNYGVTNLRLIAAERRADKAEAEAARKDQVIEDMVESNSDMTTCLAAAEQSIAKMTALLQRVVDSSVLSFEADAPEDLESLEVHICAALNPNPEAESHE